MSTNSITIIRNRQMAPSSSEEEFESVEVARFYRHWDGYIGGHGKDIALSIIEAAVTEPMKVVLPTGYTYEHEQLNNRNWCQHFLKNLCKKDIDIEFISHDESYYYDYKYVVTGDYANYGGKHCIGVNDYVNSITIEVYDYSDDLLFAGNADEFIKYYGFDK